LPELSTVAEIGLVLTVKGEFETAVKAPELESIVNAETEPDSKLATYRK